MDNKFILKKNKDDTVKHSYHKSKEFFIPRLSILTYERSRKDCSPQFALCLL